MASRRGITRASRRPTHAYRVLELLHLFSEPSCWVHATAYAVVDLGVQPVRRPSEKTADHDTLLCTPRTPGYLGCLATALPPTSGLQRPFTQQPAGPAVPWVGISPNPTPPGPRASYARHY